MTGEYMTRDQVISFVKGELECGNSILVATLGNGGAGGILVSDPAFPTYLESLEFMGEVEPCDDILASPCYDPYWPTYQFNGANGFFVQIQAE